MSVRPRTTILVATAAVVAAAGILALTGRTVAPEPAPGGASGATGTASGTATAASPGVDQGAPRGADPSAPAGSATPSGPLSGPLGEAASPRLGAGPADQPRTRREAAPLVDRAPERTESANGRIVASFPRALRPGSRGRVVSSSVAPSGRRVQATLVVRDRAAARQVLRRYHLRLAVHGFTQLSVRSVPGSAGAVFRNGPESVVVTVVGGPRPSYSVVASLVAG